MQFKQYVKSTIQNFKGGLPMPVLIWYMILTYTFVLAVVLVAYWYYAFYGIAYGGAVVVPYEYKTIIDVKELEVVVDFYSL